MAILVGIAFFGAYAGSSGHFYGNRLPFSEEQDTQDNRRADKDSPTSGKPINALVPSPPKALPPTYNGVASQQDNESKQEGTEFWPSFFGIRLKITDSLVAAFTFLLFIATVFLWRSTHLLWIAGEKQFSITAQSAEAAIALESQIFVLVRATIEVFGELTVVFTNYGRSPAIIVADSLTVDFNKELPRSPGYPPQDRRPISPEFAIARHSSYQIDRPINFTDSFIADINNDSATVWAFGYVDYMTFLKCKRREAFCVEMRANIRTNDDGQAIIADFSGSRAGNAAYNYNIEID